MKKIIISILFIFTFLLSYSTYASSFKFTATPEEKNVNPGDKVSITLKVSDIDAGNEGINVVETSLEYDSNYIDSVEFIDKNDWKSQYNSNQGNLFGKLLYTKMVTGITSDEEIGVLKFKIKDDVDEFETQIKLKNVTSNDGYSLMENGTKIVTLKYKIVPPGPTPAPPDDSEPEPKPEPQPKPTPTPSDNTDPEKEPEKEPEKNSEKEPEKEAEKKSEEKKEETQPEKNNFIPGNVQTGDIIGIVIGILLLAVVLSVILFIINKHNKNKEK